MRTLVVDDEAPARRRIRRLLAAEPGIAVVGECGDGESALALIARERPDLVFLDVQMPERDGFEVVKAIPPADLPAILFVTAHDRYALRAFDVHAVDYLLKPFSGERFRTAVGRARERIARRAADPGLASLAGALRAQPAYLTRVPVRTGGRTVFVDLAAVDWMEAADNYVAPAREAARVPRPRDAGVARGADRSGSVRPRPPIRDRADRSRRGDPAAVARRRGAAAGRGHPRRREPHLARTRAECAGREAPARANRLRSAAAQPRSSYADAIQLGLRAHEEPVAGDGGAGERELAEAVLRDLLVGVAGVDDEGVPFLAQEVDLPAERPRRRGERVADAADARLVDLACRSSRRTPAGCRCR